MRENDIKKMAKQLESLANRVRVLDQRCMYDEAEMLRKEAHRILNSVSGINAADDDRTRVLFYMSQNARRILHL